MLLSRYPITDAKFFHYTLNGKPQRYQHSDWQANKGVGYARVLLPQLQQTIDVYVTHLIASYGCEHIDEYRAHRIVQALEFLDVIERTRTSPILIAVGDFNSGSTSAEYNIISRYGALRDSFLEVNPDDTEVVGATHWVDSENPHDQQPKRIDYIFYQFKENDAVVQPIRSYVVLRPRIANPLQNANVTINSADDSFVYSDHFAVCTVFEWKTTSEPDATANMMGDWRRTTQPRLAITYEVPAFKSHLDMSKQKSILLNAHRLLKLGMAEAYQRHKVHRRRATLAAVTGVGCFIVQKYFPSHVPAWISVQFLSVLSTALFGTFIAEAAYSLLWKARECRDLRSAENRYFSQDGFYETTK